MTIIDIIKLILFSFCFSYAICYYYKKYFTKIKTNNNYSSFKKGTNMKDEEIYFIVSIGYKKNGNIIDYYENSKFLGTKEQCEINLNQFINSKIIKL